MITIQPYRPQAIPAPGVPLTMPTWTREDPRTPSRGAIFSGTTSLPTLSGLKAVRRHGSFGNANPIVEFFSPPNPADRAIRIGGAALATLALVLGAHQMLKRRKK